MVTIVNSFGTVWDNEVLVSTDPPASQCTLAPPHLHAGLGETLTWDGRMSDSTRMITTKCDCHLSVRVNPLVAPELGMPLEGHPLKRIPTCRENRHAGQFS